MPTARRLKSHRLKLTTIPFFRQVSSFAWSERQQSVETLWVSAENAYNVQDRKVSVDDEEITVRCIVPVVADERETFPVLVNMHGGG